MRRPPGEYVRVIGPAGDDLGVLPVEEAMHLAEEVALELIVISPRAQPPVYRLMDYGRFKYDQSRRERAARRVQARVLVKEVTLRPVIDEHDLVLKIAAIRGFLDEGHRAKVVVVFRARELAHPELGRALLDRVVRDAAARTDTPVLFEGRRMSLLIRRGEESVVEPPRDADPPPSGPPKLRLVR